MGREKGQIVTWDKRCRFDYFHYHIEGGSYSFRSMTPWLFPKNCCSYILYYIGVESQATVSSLYDKLS